MSVRETSSAALARYLSESVGGVDHMSDSMSTDVPISSLPISSVPISAAVFDTDGVVTDTAVVHERAWAAVFDEVLAEHVPDAPPFSHEDYLALVDGRSRDDGVVAFLGSRGLELPLGEPDDPPGAVTVWGVGNAKNERFLETLRRDGVSAYTSTVELVRDLRARGVAVAVISASRNCAEVLAAADVSGLFDVRVDGVVAAQLGLAGKPDPAVFLEAARRLGHPPSRCAVIEDAVAGVEAARRGGFALVVGVDRHEDGSRLGQAGADVVVADLSELRIADDGTWHRKGREQR